MSVAEPRGVGGVCGEAYAAADLSRGWSLPPKPTPLEFFVKKDQNTPNWEDRTSGASGSEQAAERSVKSGPPSVRLQSLCLRILQNAERTDQALCVYIWSTRILRPAHKREADVSGLTQVSTQAVPPQRRTRLWQDAIAGVHRESPKHFAVWLLRLAAACVRGTMEKAVGRADFECYLCASHLG